MLNKTDKAFWLWYLNCGLKGTHSEGKTTLDLDDKDLPKFKPIFDKQKKLIRYELE